MKRYRVLALGVMMLSAVMVFAACAGGGSAPETEVPELELTLEELAEFDGQDGRRAYVAVEGIIYDVTDLGGWSGGTHQGNMAGQDLTDVIINDSPHGTAILSRATIVGRLVD